MNWEDYYTSFQVVMCDYRARYITRESPKFALFLSAGYDSRSILYMCHRLEIPVHCYTFTLDDRISTDCRVAVAESERLGYECTVVKIPTDADTLIPVIETLAKKYGCRLKTEFECVLPLYYLHQAVTEKVILVGTDSDNYFACGSKYGLHYRKFGDEGLNRYKLDKPKNIDETYYYQEVFADAEFKQRMMLANEFGQIELDPYNTKIMYETFRDTTWDEVNKPIHKLPLYEAFTDEFEHEPPYRTSYQCGDSGVRELCADVLLNSKYNPNHKYKSVIGCYNEIVRRNVNAIRKLI